MPVSSSEFKIPLKSLKENDSTPLYRQLYDIIRIQITSGKVSKNSQLPSEQEFIQKLGISRITVRRALNELAVSGLVKRQRGIGTIVTFNAAAPSVKANFDNLLEGLVRMGVETQVQLIDYQFVDATGALAATMEVSPGTRVQRIIRLRTLENEPFSYLITHIPEYVATDYDAAELADASLLNLLETSGHTPQAAQQTISAAGAEANIASALGVAQGAPIMQIHRVMRDKDANIIQEITAHYRSDRFEYQMDLIRQDDTNWTTKE